MLPIWAWRPDLLAAHATEGRYLLPDHLTEAADRVTQAVQAGGGRIAIHMPPRHGKSELMAHWLPVWFLLHRPRAKVVVAAYDQGLAALHSRMARDSFAVLGPQLINVGVSGDAHAGDYWETDRGGSYKAVGVKTGFTGHGADLLIIDDPIKDAEEAQSETIRAKHWLWWQGVASKRLEPGASVVVIMHRWNRDDLVGRLLGDESERFRYLRFAALADGEGDDPMGRPEGAALWPERFPVEHWAPLRARGTWDWSALCQGTPRSEEGQIFRREWLEACRYTGEAGGTVYQSWDLKTKETQGGSYAVGLVARWDGKRVRLVDRIRGRFGTVDSIRHILAMRQRWGHGPVLIEEKAAGPSVIELLRGQVPGIVPVRPEVSKEQRAMAVQPFVADGSLGIPRDAPWRPELEDELADFPLGSHDDQVDATTQLLAHLFLRARALHSLGLEKLTSPNQSPFMR